MLEPADTFDVDGLTVEIHYDQDGYDHANPREYDNLGTMVCWHRGYDLGDRKPEGNETEALERGGLRLLDRYLQLTEGAYPLLQLGLIDHSGISMYVGGGAHWSDSAGWDSGTVGFIYTTRDRVNELCGAPDYVPSDFDGTPEEWIKQQLAIEVEEYDKLLTGQIYGYVIKDENGEELDSCWGFLGDDYVVQEATTVANDLAHDRDVEVEPDLETAIHQETR